MTNAVENNVGFGLLLGVDYARLEKLKAQAGSDLMATLRDKIGCEYVEVVHPEGLPGPYLMIVDEEGLMKDRPSLNVIASYLYGTHKHGQPIVGNAVIVKEVITGEGYDLSWLTESEELAIERKLEGIWAEAVITLSAYFEGQEE